MAHLPVASRTELVLQTLVEMGSCWGDLSQWGQVRSQLMLAPSSPHQGLGTAASGTLGSGSGHSNK